MMQKSSSASQGELDDFFRKVSGDDFCVRTMTKGAFSQARAKLSHEVFRELDSITKNSFYKKSNPFAWDKFRLLAIDGSTIKLPQHTSIEDEFGVHGFGPNADSQQSMARISLVYDPLNCITLDAQIGAYIESEAGLCKKHLTHIGKGDLVVFDRYYASFELIETLRNKKAEFVFRMKDDWWKVVEEFQKEGLKDKVVSIAVTKHKKVSVRLVKHEYGEDKSMVLCTSLLDQQKYSVTDIAEVYEGRWGIEESYKTLKNWCELENFSGKTALAVKQDFYAKIFMMNLGSVYAHPIDEKIRREKPGNKVNRVQIIKSTKDMPLMLFIRKKTKKAFELFDDIISRTIEMIRPNRAFERKKRPKLKFNPLSNYKYA